MSERPRRQARAQTVQLTITLEARLEDLTDDRVRQDLTQFSNVDELVDDPEIWREVGWQRQLFEAIRARPEVVQQWLVERLVEEFEHTRLGAEVGDALGVESVENDPLLPLVEDLPEEPRLYFEKAQEQGVFSESTMHVWRRAVVRLVEARLSNGGALPAPR
jgi:hypothetical protein